MDNKLELMPGITHEVDGKELPVYAVNRSPFTEDNYIQGPWECPHCKEMHVYRFYWKNAPSPFESNCPSCEEFFFAHDPDFNDDYWREIE
jgi:hypothetical protein